MSSSNLIVIVLGALGSIAQWYLAYRWHDRRTKRYKYLAVTVLVLTVLGFCGAFLKEYVDSRIVVDPSLLRIDATNDFPQLEVGVKNGSGEPRYAVWMKACVPDGFSEPDQVGYRARSSIYGRKFGADRNDTVAFIEGEDANGVTCHWFIISRLDPHETVTLFVYATNGVEPLDIGTESALRFEIVSFADKPVPAVLFSQDEDTLISHDIPSEVVLIRSTCDILDQSVPLTALHSCPDWSITDSMPQSLAAAGLSHFPVLRLEKLNCRAALDEHLIPRVMTHSDAESALTLLQIYLPKMVGVAVDKEALDGEFAGIALCILENVATVDYEETHARLAELAYVAEIEWSAY